MELKIGDFGLAAKLEFEGDRKRTICGTPNYIAPEVLDGSKGHAYAADVWSLGVITYTLLVGKPPFETSDVNTTYSRIKANAYSFPPHIHVADNAKQLIRQLLAANPAQRPSLDAILAHPFFQTFSSIPALMPISTLACPPSAAYLCQFALEPSSDSDRPLSARLEGTMPAPKALTERGSKPQLAGTQKVLLSSPKTARASAAGSKPGGAADGRPQVETGARCGLEGDRKLAGIEGAANIWVTKWVDYSSKYGLGKPRASSVGYLMCNGSLGVFYNDGSKLLLDADGQ